MSNVNKAMPIISGNSLRVVSERWKKKMNLNQSFESYVSISVKIEKQNKYCFAFYAVC